MLNHLNESGNKLKLNQFRNKPSTGNADMGGRIFSQKISKMGVGIAVQCINKLCFLLKSKHKTKLEGHGNQCQTLNVLKKF